MVDLDQCTPLGSAVQGMCEKLQKRLIRLARSHGGPAMAQALPEVEVLFADEDDPVVSRLGAKGGEIGLVGVAAAVSNAIFHATGHRIRSTPMTPDKVMRPGDTPL